MKAFSVRQKISPSGMDKETMPSAPENPMELLDRTYSQANIDDVENFAQLTSRINNPKNPICIAMTIGELRAVVDIGPEGRKNDMGRFIESLKPGSLVVLEPYGSDVDRSKQNREYLPDLALSGRDFPEIEDLRIWPRFYGKTAKKEKGGGSSIPFPESFTDTGACDRYFFGNVDIVAKKIAEEKGIKDEEKIAGISVQLNRTYTKYPEVALSQIRDTIEGEEAEEKVVTIGPHPNYYDIILDKLKTGTDK